jgi:hypothetical protein
MTGDGVSQTRANHDKLVLALGLGGAGRTAHGVVEAAQLAPGSRIHVAHAADYDVRLVVEIETVAHQLIDIDLRRTFPAPIAPAARPRSTTALVATAIAWPPISGSPIARTAIAAPWFCLLLF